MQTLESLLVFAGVMAATVILFVVLHSLPEWRGKDWLLEWSGWSLAIVAGIYLLLPYKVIDPRLPVLGHLDNVVAALVLAFCAMTGGSARQHRQARDRFPKTREEVATPKSQRVHSAAERTAEVTAV